MAITFEELHIDDWDKYLQLRSQLGSLDYTLHVDKKTFIEKYSIIKNQSSFIYVLKLDNIIIATGKLFIEYKFLHNLGHIEDIIVDSKYRSSGYGKLIVNYLITLSKQFNCYKVVLDCSDSLIPFYNSCKLQRSGSSMSLFL